MSFPFFTDGPMLAECPSPTIAHSRVVYNQENSTISFAVGEVVNVVCNAGYRFRHMSAILQLECKQVTEGLVAWCDMLGNEPPATCESKLGST